VLSVCRELHFCCWKHGTEQLLLRSRIYWSKRRTLCCPAHYYSAAIPLYECIECPDGRFTYHSNTKITQLSECQTCQANQFPYTTTLNGPITYAPLQYNRNAGECVCAKGYDYVTDWNINSQCLACGPNKAKSWLSVSFSVEKNQECAACGPNNGAISVSAAGNGHLSVAAAECKCNVGYTGPDMSAYTTQHSCTACGVGKYKNTIGSSNCTSCPSHSHSVAARTSITDCTCVSGFQASCLWELTSVCSPVFP
jgi:hypothetical protein